MQGDLKSINLNGVIDESLMALFPAETQDNFIFSPMGLWLLVAQNAYALRDGLSLHERRTIERTLGCKIEDVPSLVKDIASTEAVDLDGESSSQVSVKSAFWFDDISYNNVGERYRNDLVAAGVNNVSSGMPDSSELNAWVNKATLGIIKEAKIKDPETLALLYINAVAVDFKWKKPLIVTQDDVMSSTWGVKNVLKASAMDGAITFYKHGANIICAQKMEVTTATGADAEVISIVGEVSPEEVAALVQNISDGTAELISSEEVVSLAVSGELPSSISVTPERSLVPHIFTISYLPAWKMEGQIKDIENAIPSVGIVAKKAKVAQQVKAEYTSVGFKAAAVTSMPRASGLPTQYDTHEITVRFNSPYWVAAQVDNVPLFIARVVTAVEAEES